MQTLEHVFDAMKLPMIEGALVLAFESTPTSPALKDGKTKHAR
jgi:hypothetical protein